MNRRCLLRHAIGFALAATLGGCQSSCSLFTSIEEDDAGHWSFVRQVVPKLLGRKVKGYDEAKLMVDVINAVPDGKGREELVTALMASPEFGSHWSENLVELLRVNREGIKDNSACYGGPMRTSIDAGLASSITNQRADLPGVAPEFNMSDVVASAIAADDLFAAYSAHLFAFENKPVIGNMTTEANRRADLGANFGHIFINRKLECLQCHRSSYSRSGPQTFWQRTWPIWGNFEAAIYENEQGGDPARFNALFRTGVVATGFTNPDNASTAPARTPWGSLQQCGSFLSAAASVDALGVAPYMTQALPVGSSIWDVQRLLLEGRRTLAVDGLVRSLPSLCTVCSTPTCQTASFPAPPEPATSNLHTLFQNKGCLLCHRSGSPAAQLDLEINSPSGAWTNNLIDREVDFAHGSGIKRVVRNNPGQSYLITKLRNRIDPTGHPLDPLNASGTGMPPPGNTALTDVSCTPGPCGEIQQVENWITSLPPTPTMPAQCGVCASTACTSLPSELDGPAALAFLVGLNVSEQVWQELMGSRVTIANYFPRTSDQMRVLWNLSEFTLIPNDWSLREVAKRILLSNYFNRKSPRTTAASSPYNEPLVRDPWVEADPRVPPVALPGWTPASTTAPTPDPAYRQADHPESHQNSMSEGVHRYSVRSLTYSMHAALGWPAPQRFPGTAYPSRELVKAIGQFSQDSEPGFRDADFQGLLQWESVHRSCTKPSGTATDWIDRLLDRIASFNTANPSAQLKMRDVVIVMKDWMIGDASVSTNVLTLDDNKSEKQVLDTLFGGDIGTTTADASLAGRAALETKLREYCGVLVQTPQFWLAGIAPTGPGETPRIRVCNGAPCTYQELCTELDGLMLAANWRYRLVCGTNTVSVVQQIHPRRGAFDFCLPGVCAFWPIPGDLNDCLRDPRDPGACLPKGPPPCDLSCARIDCCGGPQPPLKPDGKARPSILLGWFEDAKIGAAKNVRVLPAAERRRGGEPKWQVAQSGMQLKAGDLLQVPAGAELIVDTPRGKFATLKGGMPANPAQGPWYLMVTGPSVARGEAHPSAPLRWLQRPDEAKRIDAYNASQRSQPMAERIPAKHDPAYRQSFRSDHAGDAAQRGRSGQIPPAKQP